VEEHKMNGLTTTESQSITPCGAAQEGAKRPVKTAEKFWGLLRRKDRWGLSGRGRLLVALLVLSLGSGLFLGIHSFLALTDRLPTDTLVVEGWINRYAIRGAVEEFKAGSYRRVFTTGGPENGTGAYVNNYQTSASVGADQMVKFGLSPELVRMVPSHVNGRDRTYSSALALRDWFSAHHVEMQSLNVLTEDAHARRTRLLFQEAFGDSVKVGVISVPNPDYDPKRWWRYSEGVREVIGETTSYLYAKFLFWPASK